MKQYGANRKKLNA